MMWRHFYHPGKWSEHPNQEKADSLTIVFKSYEDSIKQTNKEVAALQARDPRAGGGRNMFSSISLVGRQKAAPSSDEDIAVCGRASG